MQCLIQLSRGPSSPKNNFLIRRASKQRLRDLEKFFGSKLPDSEFSAITPEEFLSETMSAKVLLWSCYQQMLADQKSSSSSSQRQGKQPTYINGIFQSIANVAELFADDHYTESAHDFAPPLVNKVLFDFGKILLVDKHAQRQIPNWLVLAEIAIIIAVSTASPERGFSVLKRIVTRLRTRMSQPMTDALMRINLLDGDDLKEDETEAIAKEWYDSNARRF